MGPISAENFRVYVVHYTPFVERRRHLEAQLRNSGLDQFPLEWITEFDREEIANDHAIGKYCDPARFNASLVSVILKHLEAIRRISADTVPYHLVIEDDIFIPDDAISRINRCISELPQGWEMFFAGDGCNLHIPFWRRRLGKMVHLRGYRATWWGGGGMARCGAGYMVEPSFAFRFLGSRHAQAPFHTAIDWLMNEVGQDLKVQCYWAEPPVVCQGAFPSWTKNKRLNS